MGESAMEKQLKGKTPTASDVRVSAFRTTDTRAGSGAHEFYPTDRRGDAARDRELIPYQSGARTRTDRTFFVDRTTREVSAHTGAFPKSTGRGSTHTKGQAGAHHRLRDYKPSGRTPYERNTSRFAHQVSGLATGQDILTSSYITGALPNRRGASPLESPSATSKPERERLALEVHLRREKMKQRQDSLAVSEGRARPSSPPRERPGGPLRGGYTYDVQRPPSPVPRFTQTDSVKQESDKFAWLSGPGRIGGVSMTSRECQHCRMLNNNWAFFCSACAKPL